MGWRFNPSVRAYVLNCAPRDESHQAAIWHRHYLLHLVDHHVLRQAFVWTRRPELGRVLTTCEGIPIARTVMSEKETLLYPLDSANEAIDDLRVATEAVEQILLYGYDHELTQDGDKYTSAFTINFDPPLHWNNTIMAASATETTPARAIYESIGHIYRHRPHFWPPETGAPMRTRF